MSQKSVSMEEVTKIDGGKTHFHNGGNLRLLSQLYISRWFSPGINIDCNDEKYHLTEKLAALF